VVFIDLEKTYDKIPRIDMWRMLEKHKVPTKYITLTRDIYDNVGTSARAGDSETYTFPVSGGDRGPAEALAPLCIVQQGLFYTYY
jgi:hypothetical protein